MLLSLKACLVLGFEINQKKVAELLSGINSTFETTLWIWQKSANFNLAAIKQMMNLLMGEDSIYKEQQIIDGLKI